MTKNDVNSQFQYQIPVNYPYPIYNNNQPIPLDPHPSSIEYNQKENNNSNGHVGNGLTNGNAPIHGNNTSINNQSHGSIPNNPNAAPIPNANYYQYSSSYQYDPSTHSNNQQQQHQPITPVNIPPNLYTNGSYPPFINGNTGPYHQPIPFYSPIPFQHFPQQPQQQQDQHQHHLQQQQFYPPHLQQQIPPPLPLPQHQHLPPPQQQPPQRQFPTQRKKFSVKAQAFIPQKDHTAYLTPSINKPVINETENTNTTTTTTTTNDDDNDNDTNKANDNNNGIVEAIDSSDQEIKDTITFTTDNIKSPNLNSPLIISDSLQIDKHQSTTITGINDTVESTTLENDNNGLVFEYNQIDPSKVLTFGTSIQQFKDEKKRSKSIDETDSNTVVAEQRESTPLPITTPSNTATNIASPPLNKITGWAAIAQKGAQKQSLKSSSSSSPSSSTSNNNKVSNIKKDEQVKFVASVSNVLEPIGIVILRYIFDKNFQKTLTNVKIPKITPRGLVNTGNICFMSSILQLLLYCQPFYKSLNIIANKSLSSITNSQTPLFDSIVSLYKNFNQGTSSTASSSRQKNKFGDSIIPTDFYKSISSNERFQHLKWGQQEDAEEFFGYLLDGLHEEFLSSIKNLTPVQIKTLLNSIPNDDITNLIKSSLKKFKDEDFSNSNSSTFESESSTTTTSSSSIFTTDDGWQEVSNKKGLVSAKRTVEVKPSPIRMLFGGQFRSILNIPKQKESQSITLDPFLQIQLDISDDNTKTLIDAFKKISEVESIPYKSSNGEDVIATKQTFIDKLPQVLIIHLKRFSYSNASQSSGSSTNGYYSNSNGRIEKLLKKIEYNHQLNLPLEIISPTSRKFIKSTSYKLTGVVYHIGANSDGGHYTVDVLRNNNDSNDEDNHVSNDGWISIDDTNITELTPDQVLQNGDDKVKTPYILMYQKI